MEGGNRETSYDIYLFHKHSKQCKKEEKQTETQTFQTVIYADCFLKSRLAKKCWKLNWISKMSFSLWCYDVGTLAVALTEPMQELVFLNPLQDLQDWLQQLQ